MSKGGQPPMSANPGAISGLLNHRFLRFPLQIGIISAFVLLAVPSITGIVWFVYHRNSREMRAVAEDTMAHASAAMISQGVGMLDAVGDTVEVLAAIGDRNAEDLREAGILPVLLNALRNAPQTYGFYAGFASDGGFNQAIRLPKGARTFGPQNTPVPAGARYVLCRIVRPSGGKATQTYMYLSDSGTSLLRVTTVDPHYDPRVRPFFHNALRYSTERVVSKIYIFESTRKPGLTVSRGFGYSGLYMVGAVAADFDLESMSEFLKTYTPGQHGIALIIDGNGQLIAHPDPRKVVRSEGDAVKVMMASALDDIRIKGALEAHSRKPGLQRFIFTATDGKDYIASVTAFPANLGTQWELLIVVPLDDFVTGLKQATRQILLLGTGVLFLVVLGIRALSTALTRSIARLIEETQRIRCFELEGDINLPSRITEIIAMGGALQTVKVALRSFAKFTPRTLVQDLLRTGNGLGLGGENRVVTVMFTDLSNFSTLAENITPSDLVLRTSDYLEVVSREVIRHNGTIDKYIGDSVMALWGAPITDAQHAQHACFAALYALHAFEESNQRWALEGWPPIGIRIGLHSDSVVVGVIGSEEHVSYTALGDGVNIAARLEGVNKVYGTSICVSGTIHAEVSHSFLMRPLDHVTVKGRRQPILIYELIGVLSEDSEIGTTPEQREQARMTELAFSAWMAKDFKTAKACYRALLDRFPQDAVARLYLNRCEEDAAITSVGSASTAQKASTTR